MQVQKKLLTNEYAASKITTITTTTKTVTTNPIASNMFPIMLELSTQSTNKTKKKNKELLQQTLNRPHTNNNNNNNNNNTLFVSTTNATNVPNKTKQQQQTVSIAENPYSTAISSRYMNVVPEHWSRAQSYYSLMHKWDSHVWPTPVTAMDRHLDRPPSARYIRDVNQKQIDRCRMFVEGDPAKNEFYSPDFPNNYPKNINCTKVIEAPQGQIIRLDFRNSFHIENMEDCKFDFLEIRDGAYGFSNPLGKYCGSNFPPEITSKERYLWLHFHSDESIEYSGFTAVYEFIDRSREAPSTDLNCTILKNRNEDWINSTDVPEDKMEVIIKNKIPLDCMWRIQVADNWKIQLKFFNYKLARPNHCKINFLDIFPEETVMPLRVKNFCGSAGESITSESNILHIRYYAEPIAINDTMFSILYTAFRDRGSGTCAEDEYDCEDATCIAAELKCNQRDNCKFRWDEEGCENETVAQSEHVIIIVTVFGLILGGMIVTFLVNCVRKIMRDQKIIREAPSLSNNIYHTDSFVLNAPKTTLFVGLTNDYMPDLYTDNLHTKYEHTNYINEQDLNGASNSTSDSHSVSLNYEQSSSNSSSCCTYQQQQEQQQTQVYNNVNNNQFYVTINDDIAVVDGNSKLTTSKELTTIEVENIPTTDDSVDNITSTSVSSSNAYKELNCNDYNNQQQQQKQQQQQQQFSWSINDEFAYMESWHKLGFMAAGRQYESSITTASTSTPTTTTSATTTIDSSSLSSSTLQAITTSCCSSEANNNAASLNILQQQQQQQITPKLKYQCSLSSYPKIN